MAMPVPVSFSPAPAALRPEPQYLFNLGQAAAYAVYQIALIGIVMFISQRFLGVKAHQTL